MNERGKSDSPVVPAKPLNKILVAEVVEGRGLAKGNTASTTCPGHRAGPGAPNGLDRVRESARKDKGTTPSPTHAFTSAPKAGAQCVSSARWDLRGGPPARAVPTANIEAKDVLATAQSSKAASAIPLENHDRPGI